MQIRRHQMLKNSAIQPSTEHYDVKSVNKAENLRCDSNVHQTPRFYGFILTRLIRHQNLLIPLEQPLKFNIRFSSDHIFKVPRPVDKSNIVGLAGIHQTKPNLQRHKTMAPKYVTKASGAFSKHANVTKVLAKHASNAKHQHRAASATARKTLSQSLHGSFAISFPITMQAYTNPFGLSHGANPISEPNGVGSGPTTSGLSAVKKLLLNRVCAVNNVLVPGYNRRSHSISHTNSVINQQRKVSKTFGYVAKKTLRFWVGLALAACYGTGFTALANGIFKGENLSPALVHWHQSQSSYFSGDNKSMPKAHLNHQQCLNVHQKPTILFVNGIETRASVLLWRTQMCKSVGHAKQAINHQQFKWIKHPYPLERFRQSLKHKLYGVNKSTKLNPRTNLNIALQEQYYPVISQAQWAYCGSALRFLPLWLTCV